MRVIVYGASDQGKYTVDILDQEGRHDVVGFIDDDAEIGSTLYDRTVLGRGDDLRGIATKHRVSGGVIAIGDNHTRWRVSQRVRAALPEFEFVTAIHPFTSIGRDSRIGPGTVLMAGAIVSGSCSVGEHCLLGNKASLDHDSTMGDFASMSPGSTTGGNVVVGDFTTLSIGSSVLHGVTIAPHVVIGAGAIVTHDIPSHVVAYGTPCKIVRPRREGEPYL